MDDSLTSFDRHRAGRLAAVVLALTAAAAEAQSLSAVPGVVLRSLPSPPSIGGFVIGSPRVYTASPSIAVLPSGEYVVTDNNFGEESGASVSGTTRVFRSADKGATWSVSGTLAGMKRGSLFTSGSTLFLMGYLTDNGNASYPGDAVIRRSTDGGRTWTVPTTTSTGLLGTGGAGTPNAPVVHGGRLWIAQGGKRVRSIAVGADPLIRGNWTRSDNANTDGGPYFTPDLVISEAQIVAAPHTGVVVIPKVQRLDTAVLLRPSADPAVMAPVTNDDWISLPGGEKKFAVRYDAVGGQFVALTNPVLPADRGFLPDQPELVRNTAALLTSRDLKTWDVRQIFLYSPNVATEAFQYLQFDIDGDDLVVASRTAFDIGGTKPPRGHDSNLTTFHRIPGFRTAAPRHVAVIDGGNVLRRELTQHAPAPLGSFVQGTTFAGAPLSNPVGLGQAGDGTVYVAEQGGRILRFDPLGNFLETVAAAPVPLTSGSLALAQPAAGERTWVSATGGDWFDLTAWHQWNRPDANHETVTLGTAITADRTLSLDRGFTMKGIRFRSDHRYTLSGSGSLVLDADAGAAILHAERGGHVVGVPVTLADDTELVVDAGTWLRLDRGVALGGRRLRAGGGGEAILSGTISGAGSLVVTGSARVTLTAAAAAVHSGSTAVLGGTLELAGRLSGSTTVLGGRVRVASAAALASGTLAVGTGGVVEVAPNLTATVARLTLSGDGRVDVGTGGLTLAAGLSAADLVAGLVAGRNGGGWDGTAGIASAAVAAEVAAGGMRAVGWRSEGGGALTVAYAAPGDTNLDRVVDVLDAADLVSSGKYGAAATASWSEGDFTYDGFVDVLDIAEFAGTGLYGGPAYGGVAVAAVPEPAGRWLAIAGLIGWLAFAALPGRHSVPVAADPGGRPRVRKPVIRWKVNRLASWGLWADASAVRLTATRSSPSNCQSRYCQASRAGSSPRSTIESIRHRRRSAEETRATTLR